MALSRESKESAFPLHFKASPTFLELIFFLLHCLAQNQDVELNHSPAAARKTDSITCWNWVNPRYRLDFWVVFFLPGLEMIHYCIIKWKLKAVPFPFAPKNWCFSSGEEFTRPITKPECGCSLIKLEQLYFPAAGLFLGINLHAGDLSSSN